SVTCRSSQRALINAKRKIWPRGLQEKDVIRVNHRAVGFSPVSCPHWPLVERREILVAALHISKSAQPDEPIGVASVSKLPDDGHAHRFLRLDKVLVKQVDEHVALLRLECVLSQFNDGATTHLGTVLSTHAPSDRRRHKKSHTRRCADATQVIHGVVSDLECKTLKHEGKRRQTRRRG